MYCRSVPFEDRVDELLSWFDKPPDKWPHFLTMYLHQPDKAGHFGGPFSDWVSTSMSRLEWHFSEQTGVALQ